MSRQYRMREFPLTGLISGHCNLDNLEWLTLQQCFFKPTLLSPLTSKDLILSRLLSCSCIGLVGFTSAPSPRLACSDNSSPRYIWCPAPCCHRCRCTCLSGQHHSTCQATYPCHRDFLRSQRLTRSGKRIWWQTPRWDFFCFLLDCTCKIHSRALSTAWTSPSRTCRIPPCLCLVRPLFCCK